MKIIDLSWRLPGPLATYLLAKQGFEVIKYEDKFRRDPFLNWTWDESFLHIYNSFQSNKIVKLIDFNSPEDIKNLHDEIRTANAVVMSFPDRIEEKLGLNFNDVKLKFNDVCFIRLGFRKGSKENAHDLNTLVHSNLLKLHILDRKDDIIAPPILPVTGMFFSHHIAITVLYVMIKQKLQTEPIQEWCFLQDSVDNAQQAYYPKSIQGRNPATFLHNGRFPCYNIYRTLDNGYVAIAVVEPKFWARFRELTELSILNDDDGLCEGARSDEVKKIIFNKINQKTLEQWELIFKDENCCVDVIRI